MEDISFPLIWFAIGLIGSFLGFGLHYLNFHCKIYPIIWFGKERFFADIIMIIIGPISILVLIIHILLNPYLLTFGKR